MVRRRPQAGDGALARLMARPAPACPHERLAEMERIALANCYDPEVSRWLTEAEEEVRLAACCGEMSNKTAFNTTAKTPEADALAVWRALTPAERAARQTQLFEDTTQGGTDR